ncbi:iron reductase domain protein [Parathielavia appendiculata]|uniref:Iron reductase domain protein n=1 Tax=Parathielavia appendiculata TaxID=2587402 RepID=A0AAN6TQP1_9PEZI|nr:iron reductase domain protein [Parathielavia appendiculata]
MQLLQSIARAAAFLGLARRQFEADSSVFEDLETGLTFASYTSDRGITFRVAIPDPVPEKKVFDTVLQIVSPNDVGWAGWAWGGHMTYNPLAVAWANETNSVVLSSRIAYGYFSPPEYPDSTYTILETGTHLNATHWQVTAKCTGCSRWGDDDMGYTELDPQYHTTMAFAYSDTPVDAPGDETTTFGIHTSLGHPIYDLATAKNSDFAAKVGKL